MNQGERWREAREKLQVGPVIVSALILDQFTGYTRMPEPSVSSSETPPSCYTGDCASPTRRTTKRGVFIQTRADVSTRTSDANIQVYTHTKHTHKHIFVRNHDP